MPRKVRELIRDLERAGFELQSVRGSHRKYELGSVGVIVSGGMGEDAREYQEKAVRKALCSVEE